jgi:hypothetical protein
VKAHQSRCANLCPSIHPSIHPQGIKQRNKKWVTEWATSSNDPDMLGVDKNSIFVGGLNATLITRELLEERFSKYGKVESLTLINPMKPAATTTTATNTTATDSGDNAATTATTAVEGKVENDVASVEAPATNEDSSTTVIEQSEAGAESEDKVGATTDNSNINNTNAEDNEDDDDTSDDSEDSLHAKALSSTLPFFIARCLFALRKSVIHGPSARPFHPSRENSVCIPEVYRVRSVGKRHRE